MRRLRYICGGEDGREAKGSNGCNGEDTPGEVMTPEDGTAGRTLSSAGAPLTSWSNLDSDMAVEDHKLADQVYSSSAHSRRGCEAMPGITLLLTLD